MQPYLWISRDQITPISLSWASIGFNWSPLTNLNSYNHQYHESHTRVGWINPNNNITLYTSNSNDHSSNSRMQNSALHTIYFRKFDKYRVDPLVIEHLNTQGKSDPRGGLDCFLVSKQNLNPFSYLLSTSK